MPRSEIIKSWSLNQNTVILRKSRHVNFAEIFKIATIFIKIIFKYSKKVKSIRNYVL